MAMRMAVSSPINASKRRGTGIHGAFLRRANTRRVIASARAAAFAGLFAFCFARQAVCQSPSASKLLQATTQFIAELPDDPGASIQASGAAAQANAPAPAPAQAPAPVPAPASSADAPGSIAVTGSISGVALDVNGGAVPGAAATLTAQGARPPMKTAAGSDGTFTFSGLAPGVYRVTVAAKGFGTYVSAWMRLVADQSIEVPTFGLAIASASASIDVTATEQQVAAAQVHEQEKQRVFGVLPNFYTSYIWRAAPMDSKQKFGLAARSLVDPVELLIVAGVAGGEQIFGVFPDYGSGIEGYGTRYGARYADTVSSRLLSSAIFPSLLRQDPRYFYRGTGSVASRTWYAMSMAFITRSDKGVKQPNYSQIFGNLAAGGISNLYRPSADRGAAITFETSAVDLGVVAVGNIVREFLLRQLTPALPKYDKGERSASKQANPAPAATSAGSPTP